MRWKFFSLFVVILVITPAVAVWAAPHGNAKRGKRIYEMFCVACHGEKGDGHGPYAPSLDPKPRDFTKGDFKYGKSDEDLFYIISEGKQPMPSWEALQDHDRWDVVAYIRSLKKNNNEKNNNENNSKN